MLPGKPDSNENFDDMLLDFEEIDLSGDSASSKEVLDSSKEVPLFGINKPEARSPGEELFQVDLEENKEKEVKPNEKTETTETSKKTLPLLFVSEEGTESSEEALEEIDPIGTSREGLPELDDETIVPLSYDDIYEEEEFEAESDQVETAELPKLERKKKEYTSPFASRKAKESEKIDKKNKKIIPTGSQTKIRTEKVKVKTSDFDERKNLNVKWLIARGIFIAVALVVLFLGIKNTYFPKQIYTPEEIHNLVVNSMGMTGFNLEIGKHLVEGFTDTLLSDKPDREELLREFYLTDQTGSQSIPFYYKSNDSTNTILIGPTVVQAKTYDENQGDFVVTSFVETREINKVDPEQTVGKIDRKWITLHINVFYDTVEQNYSIIPETVALKAPIALMSASDISVAEKPGVGDADKDLADRLAPTINGFIREWGKATENSHESLLQYIPKEADPSLYRGFGGQFWLDGEPASAISKEAYHTNDPNEFKVITATRWTDGLNVFVSKDVVTLRVVSDEEGKFVVTKFAPFVYIKSN